MSLPGYHYGELYGMPVIDTIEKLIEFRNAGSRFPWERTPSPLPLPLTQQSSESCDNLQVTPNLLQASAGDRGTDPLEEQLSQRAPSRLGPRGSYRLLSVSAKESHTCETTPFSNSLHINTPSFLQTPERPSQSRSNRNIPVEEELSPCGSDFSWDMDAQIAYAQAIKSNSFYSQASSSPEEEVQYDPNRPTLVHRLSKELMSRIFTFYVDSNADESALLLGSICGLWRQVAWRTTTLWTHLTVYGYSKDQQYQHELVSQWLKRSGQRMFHLNWYHRENREDQKQLPYLERVEIWDPSVIIQLLKQHSHRCTSLKIEGPDKIFTLFEREDFHFPKLKYLSIERTRAAGQSPSFRGFSLTPQLTDSIDTLQMCGLDTDRLYLMPEAKFSNLTEIITRTMDISLALEFLQHTTSLQKLRISYFLRAEKSLDDINSQFPNRITCPSIHTLEVFGIDETDREIYPLFFGKLNLPNLTTLSCKHWVTEECLNMIKRSGCSLHTLYLRKFVASTDKFIDCLSVLPTLINLHISIVEDRRQDCGRNKENEDEYAEFDFKQTQEWRVILAALACGTIPRHESDMVTVHRPHPLYLPLLQKLEIYGTPHCAFPWSLLCRFLDSRGPPPKNPEHLFRPDECVPALEYRTLKHFKWTMTNMGGPVLPVRTWVLGNLKAIAGDGLIIDMVYKGRYVRMKQVRGLHWLTEVRTERLIHDVPFDLPSELIRDDDVDFLIKDGELNLDDLDV